MRRCTETVTTNGWSWHRCTFSARYGDKCGVHDPAHIEARAKARGPTQFERACARLDTERANLKALVRTARTLLRYLPQNKADTLRGALAPYTEVK